MKKEQIAKAIADNARCTYHDCSYIVYGYERYHIPGYETDECMLLITKDARTEIHAPLKDVVLEGDDA